MATSPTPTTTPRFRLLLHGQDGSVPYLTPELMRQVFCPNDNKEGKEDDCCWKWHREHFILGVAVKDTCVTAVYRETSSCSSSSSAKSLKKKKRKNNNRDGSAGSDDRPEKRAKKEQSTTSDSTSSQTNQSSETTSSTEGTDKTASLGKNINGKVTPLKNGSIAHNKKPSGYTFLTPSKSSQVCADIIKNSPLGVRKNNNAPPPNNYMHTHLRIPQYISTLIVPTFSLDYPEIEDVTTASDDATKEAVAGDAHDKRKKYAPKKEQPNTNPKKQKQQQQQQHQQTHKGTVVIPNSTKDTMPVDTPHGWQKLRPEQYWDAVVSLTADTASDDNGSTTALPLPSGTATAAAADAACPPTTTLRCEGAVGLFDHMGIPRNQINYLFDKFMHGKSNNDNDNDIEGATGSNATAALTPQAQKALSRIKSNPPVGKWDTYLQRLVQRTNDWSIRTTQQNNGDERTPLERTAASTSSSSSIRFWTPVQMAASYLPPQSLFARFQSRGIRGTQQRGPPSENNDRNGGVGPASDNVAIVGWGAISYGREHRRRALRQLMDTMRSASPTPRQYLVISVCDLQSMLDAARGGVSIIGTDMVRLWSRNGRALCLDLTLGDAIDDKEKNGKHQAEDANITGGMMDLREERYARDSLPILPGREFKAPVLSFSRAYIHHLIKAKEMLAETLLFVHNLHQVLLLMRRLSEAASLDDCGSGEDGGSKGRLEAFCQMIEEQL